MRLGAKGSGCGRTKCRLVKIQNDWDDVNQRQRAQWTVAALSVCNETQVLLQSLLMTQHPHMWILMFSDIDSRVEINWSLSRVISSMSSRFQLRNCQDLYQCEIVGATIVWTMHFRSPHPIFSFKWVLFLVGGGHHFDSRLVINSQVGTVMKDCFRN